MKGGTTWENQQQASGSALCEALAARRKSRRRSESVKLHTQRMKTDCEHRAMMSKLGLPIITIGR